MGLHTGAGSRAIHALSENHINNYEGGGGDVDRTCHSVVGRHAGAFGDVLEQYQRMGCTMACPNGTVDTVQWQLLQVL